MAENNNKDLPANPASPEEPEKTLKAPKQNGKSNEAFNRTRTGSETTDQQVAEQEERYSRKEISEKQNAPGNSDAGETPDDRVPDGQVFPVVGVGASAGGLEALEQFLSGLPEKCGIAFVIVSHTHPDHPTRMPEILQRKSPLKIVLLEDGMTVEPDTVYIPPSDMDPVMESGKVRLQKRTGMMPRHMPIDIFLKSLADERGEAAGCVILSGTGTDGTGGLRRIKEEAGVVFVQQKESARHAGMPASAIETGMVDYVLTPADMPAELIAYFQHRPVIKHNYRKAEKIPEALPRLLRFLADRTNHDFSQYKKNTLIRRIERRMNVNRCHTHEAYLKFLHRNPEESQALFKDLLIGVTNFFRDPDVFTYVENHILPDLLVRGEENDSFRVWIPGCSTGEEAYSVIIILMEAMERLNIKRQVQVFATDIDRTAIEKARQGKYPKNIAADVSEERLRRFFIAEENHYQAKKEIREPIVFAEQNVLRDPPFMHLDMLVCRNLLIYLEPDAQNKILPLFHYNLKTEGILFLGTSESTGKFVEMFKPVNKKYSIYRKRDTINRPPQIQFPTGKRNVSRTAPGQALKQAETEQGPPDIGSIITDKSLKNHTPICVIVNDSGEIVYIHGRVGKFLEHAPGKPTMRIIDSARDGLRHTLSEALNRAAGKNMEIRKSGIRVKTNGGFTTINLTVKPLDDQGLNSTFMILFEERPEFTEDPARKPSETSGEAPDIAEDVNDAATLKIAELERDLDDLRQDYLSTSEELQSSNEELKSSNEEMFSSNEELQSANEELESSREELESLNEELSTVNSELYEKIDQIQSMYNSMTNILSNTGIAIVFLDNDLKVERFTEEASRLINLIDSDVGRPLNHISHTLEFRDLNETARQVLKTLAPYEEEVRTTNGQCYRMRIMPHRTEKNTIEGAVLTFINIDPQKKAQDQLKAYNETAVSAARRYTENIVDTVRESILVLDADLRVVSANRRFYDLFALSAGETVGKYIFELGHGEWDIPELRRLLEEVVTQNNTFEDYMLEHLFKKAGFRRMCLNARQLRKDQAGQTRILLAIDDITK